jgi:Spy/CpxP family protein refolding chaperone
MEDRMPKAREIRKSHMDQVRAVLTSEQQTKLDEMQKKMMERRGGPGGPGGDRPHGDQPPPPQQ